MPAIRPGAAPTNSISPNGVERGSAGWAESVTMEPSASAGGIAPAPVTNSVTIDPAGAGFSAELIEPSWFSAAAGVLLTEGCSLITSGAESIVATRAVVSRPLFTSRTSTIVCIGVAKGTTASTWFDWTESSGAGIPLKDTDYACAARLTVFEHQWRLINLLTKFGWQIRIAAHDKQNFDIEVAAQEIVDYMLFVDEAPLRDPIESG